nr:RNA-directed DNA polymerase, eukaryota [Tanacetum cinerariifolium]
NKEAASLSDDESIHGKRLNDDNLSFSSEEVEGEFNASNAEGVAETVFGDNSISPKCLNDVSRDPLAPYLLIPIMESLHLSFSKAVDARIFMGIKIDSSLTISHIFYADDAVFI